MRRPTPSPDDLKPELEALHADSFSWACHCCRGDRETARDVLQTSYLKVISGKAQYLGNSTVKTWFFGILRLTALEHFRKESKQRDLQARFVRPKVQRSEAGIALDRETARKVLGRLLGALPDRQRDVIELVSYKGFSLNEAATALGISPGSARQHYARAKKKLRTLFLSQPALADEFRRL